MTVSLGDRAPDFELADTEGASHSLHGHGGPTVVVFTCNHCPYALAWHDRLADVARDYAGSNVRMLAVNSNDSDRYPADSYAAMQSRVGDEQWPHPYLHDATQEVARAWDAKTTPDVFLVDAEGVLRYRGAPDADYDDPAEKAAWLRDALDALLAGEEVARAETEPVGCSIKWKPGP